VLSASDYAELLAGTLYFNVHTVANVNGEIRGAITGTSGVSAGLATLNSSQEVPSNSSTAVGRGTILFDSATREILIAYATHNVTGANAAHIHTGAPGIGGGPADVASLSAVGTTLYVAPGGATMSPTNVTNFTAGNAYFNIHSPTYPDGEIRGQIAVQ
jgi:CHRD domain